MTNAIPIDAGLAYDDLYPDGKMGLVNDEFVGFGDIPVDFFDYLEIAPDGKVINKLEEESFSPDISENILEDEEVEQIRSSNKGNSVNNIIPLNLDKDKSQDYDSNAADTGMAH